MTLAQAPDLLGGLDGIARFIVAAAFVALAGGVAWLSARTDGFGPAVAYWLGGLVIAGAFGWLFGGVETALFGASVYLVFAAGGQIFALAREHWEIGFWGVLAGLGLVGVMALADVKTGAFIAASAVIVYSALKTLASDRLVHAALWLAGVLVGVAGIFLSLGAEFLAAIQILVYVGAVITLFLFTVMLTIPEEEARLEGIEQPPGIQITSIRDLNPTTPAYGVGPFKGLAETNPRKPVQEPDTLYGVALTDGIYGRDDTVRRKSQKEEGS